MRVGELIEQLKKYPKDLECVYARDEEGNGYEKVHYSPCVGKLDNSGEFINKDECNKRGYENYEEVVCIN